MRNKILLSLVALALTVLVTSSAYATCLPPPCGCGLSPGYWKHNVKVYNGGPGHYSGDPHETDDSMEEYAAIIAANFYASFTLAWANTRFQDNQYKDQAPTWLTIANWFNAASGRFPYSD